MDIEKRDFDKVAAQWDENPARVRLANDIADAIIRQIAITSGMNAMDFGCGTGLLTLRLQTLVNSVTGIDSSQGMLDILNTKVAGLKLTNVSGLLFDLDKGDILTGEYDLITSSMTLHHVGEIAPLLNQFHNVMAPGGYLCIADLDLDNGQFHEDNTGVVHAGFDREELRGMFIEAGFDDVQVVTAAEVQKPGMDGKMNTFTVFLMCCRKAARI